MALEWISLQCPNVRWTNDNSSETFLSRVFDRRDVFPPRRSIARCYYSTDLGSIAWLPVQIESNRLPSKKSFQDIENQFLEINGNSVNLGNKECSRIETSLQCTNGKSKSPNCGKLGSKSTVEPITSWNTRWSWITNFHFKCFSMKADVVFRIQFLSVSWVLQMHLNGHEHFIIMEIIMRAAFELLLVAVLNNYC